MRTLTIAHHAPSRPLPRSPQIARAGLGRRVAWMAATLLAVEILYVIVGNLFLRFGFLPLVNGAPETVFMAYDRAYTLWPSVVNVRGYHLRSQDRTIQWDLDVDEGNLTIDLPALFRQKFRATRVRATGVAFRLRRKLDTASAAQPRARALPPIQGFADPPLRPIGPDEPLASDEDYSLWTAQLEDIDAVARELWVDEIRHLGPTRVQGGFFFKPERLIQVGPVTIDITRSEVRVGDYVAASTVDAHLEAIVGAIDLQGPVEDAARAISMRAQIAAQTPGIELVRLYLGDAPEVRVEDGHGSMRADLRLEGGKAMPGTTLALESPRLVLGGSSFATTFDYRFEAKVVAADPAPLATGDLFIHRATIVREGAEGASPRLEDARAHFHGLPRDLVGPATIERIDLDAPAKIPALGWVLPAGQDRPVTLGGSAALRARVTLDRALRATGNVEVSSGDVEVKTPSLEVRGRLSSTTRFHDADLATQSLVLDPSVLLAEDVAIVQARRAHGGGSLRVDVEGGRLEGGVPRDLTLALAAKVPDLGWMAWKAPKGGDPSLAAIAADVSAKLSIPRPASLFDGTEEDAAITGSIALRSSGSARFTEVSLRGQVEATAQIARLDLGRGVVHLRGLDVVTRDLAVDHGSARTRGWWGRFAVPRLDLEARSADVFTMHADARCKDGGPFLAVLASEGSIPGWTSKIFPMNELTASADLRLSRDKLDLDLRARGSSASVTARLHDIGDAMSGAIKIETKLASLGFGFEGGESKLKVFAGEDWLQARIAEANAKESADRAQPAAPTTP